MAWGSLHLFSFYLLALSLSSFLRARSQSISTSTPVPPLQWINLTGLLSGSGAAAPPLKGASLGWDDSSHSLLIFGGESQDGIPQSSTYLLNTESLTWYSPSPPSGMDDKPSARYGALGGSDTAASYRRGHIIYGGIGSNGQGLDDAWEFDYNNQFWQQIDLSNSPSSPSARGGASGGIDTRVGTTQDSTLSWPNNTFYLAGGHSGSDTSPLSDVWQLDITGVLSANNLNQVYGSWQQISMDETLPSKTNQGSAVISKSVIAVGGCNVTSDDDDTCAQQDSYVINTGSGSDIAPDGCPAPRYGPAVTPNLNAVSSSFNTQIFILLGTFNASFWDDDGGLEKGEVDVLDYQTGAWARILPSGDPGASGDQTPAVPSPREGAAVISIPSAVTTGTTQVGADTIVFGGRDANGNYLNDVWLLRAYNGTITQTNQSWSGGSGSLQGGGSANGQGVTVQYMTRCAQAISQPSSSGSPSSPSSPSSTGSPSSPISGYVYDTAVTHKSLAPLSIAVLLGAAVAFRVALPSTNSMETHSTILHGSAVLVIIAYGLGIAGLAASFTSITSTATYMKRDTSSGSSNINLMTAHGRAGLALFIAMYGVLPAALGTLACWYRARRPRGKPEESTENDEEEESGRPNSQDASEKQGSSPALNGGEQANASPKSTRRHRTHSWGGIGLLSGARPARNERRSTDSALESVASTSQPKGFEVVNRPARARKTSSSGRLTPEWGQRPPGTPRSLNDMSWMDRRRSVGMMGDLDYAMSHLTRPNPVIPGTPDIRSTRALMNPPEQELQTESLQMPGAFEITSHVLFHALLLALSVLSLQALWSRAPIAAFAIFLAWTLLLYLTMFILAWFGRPKKSMLTVFFSRLRGDTYTVTPTVSAASPAPSRGVSSIGLDQYSSPVETRSPYVHHQPTYWAAGTREDVSNLHASPRSVETDDDDDEVDEATRQQRMEEEMARRDVSIITVPKRKLWITNPS